LLLLNGQRRRCILLLKGVKRRRGHRRAPLLLLRRVEQWRRVLRIPRWRRRQWRLLDGPHACLLCRPRPVLLAG
jgi:hypothetical protein